MVTAAVTLLCLVACPSDPPPAIQMVNEEWRSHTAPMFLDATFTLDAFQLPHRRSTPSSNPRPTPKPPSSSGVEQWRPLITAHFPPNQVETALCIIQGESRGDPNANNPTSTAAGLWQFLKSTWDDMVPASVTGGSYSSGQVYDPEASTRAAAWLWANLGWTQWNAYRRCR